MNVTGLSTPGNLERKYSMSNGIYAEELAGMLATGCGNPDCENSDCTVAKWLHAKCHMEAGLDIKFVDGALEVYCNVCKQLVVSLILAKKPESGG